MWHVNLLETKQRPNHFAQKLVDATAIIQTTLPHQKNCHDLAFAMPKFWQGMLGHKPNIPLISWLFLTSKSGTSHSRLFLDLCQASYTIVGIVFYMCN